MRLTPATRLGPYEIVARIGAGGMGEVYRARDDRLGRDVALKVLPPEFEDDAQLRLRFEREARAISQLNHPHICTVYDVGEGYLVMELLEGETLASRIARGPMPLPDVLRIGAQIADALDKAHRNHVVHRDLKPGNVMLTRNGAKLLDFGLAKSIVRAGGADEATMRQEPITADGVILGTLQYMAPEQLGGEEVDERADIFALGAILYEMLTGRRAFEASSRSGVIAAIATAQPRPITELLPQAPPALVHLVGKCLEKEKDDRWQSAHDIAGQLAWMRDSASATMPQPQEAMPRRIRRRLGAVAAVAVALGLIAAASFVSYRAAQRRAHPAGLAYEIPGETAHYSYAEDAAISPDGTRVAFSAYSDSGYQIFVRALDSLEAKPLEGTGHSLRCFWTADSRSILFVKGGKLSRVSAAGGPVQELAPAAEALGASSNAQDVILFAGGGTGVMRLDPGGAARPITKLGTGQIAHVYPLFLPDGRHFLFTALMRDLRNSEIQNRLYAGSLDSPETKLIGDMAESVVYSEDGYLLTVRDRTLVAIPFDAEKLAITGEAIPVMDAVAAFQPQSTISVSLAKSGTLLCRDWDDTEPLRWLAPDGKVERVFPDPFLRSWGRLRLSADGQALAVANLDPKRGTTDVWLWGINRDTRTRLTFDMWCDMHPLLSPDGKKVYFASSRSGWPDIYERTIGSGEERLVVEAPRYQRPDDISPDGRFLLYNSDEFDAGYDLFAVATDKPSAKPIAIAKTPASEGLSARFAPDGRWVVYTSNESGKSELWVRRFPDLDIPRQLTSGGASNVAFSRDGKRILFERGRAVYALDFDTANGTVGDETKVLDSPHNFIADWEVAPDGGLLVQSMSERRAPIRVYTDWTRLLHR